MSGETSDNVSGWTVDTALDHLRSLIAEADRRNLQRFEGQEMALEKALISQEKAVNAALTAAKEAVDKAERAAEQKFEATNEFRAQLSDQAATFMPRREAEQRMNTNSEKVADLERRNAELIGLVVSRLDRIEAHHGGMAQSWGVLIAAVGGVGAVVAIVVAVMH